jgi:multiple sugar transport system substrate-binding protein
MNRHVFRALALGAFLVVSLPAVAQQKLTIWWEKGFYKAEDDALLQAIKKFEDKTGVKVELSLYPVQDLIPKMVAALDASSPPDLSFGNIYDFQVAGKWAYEGKLADISDVIEPIKSRFAPNTVETAFLYNDKTKKKAYYAFPLKQNSMHVEYWLDMLEQAGFKESDIPHSWSDYWSFWCDKVQPGVRKATGRRVYGLGLTMGVDSTDAFYQFLTFMDAYNVKLVDDDGKLLVDDPKVKAGLVAALTEFIRPYQNGCVPPSSTTWKDPDNNVAFANKTVVLTPNSTISIATKALDDMNDQTVSPEGRAEAKKNYESLIRTVQFPNKPDGSVLKLRSAVRVGFVFEDAKNKAGAKDFVTFMLQEENLTPYIEGALGRWYPVMTEAQERPFWQSDRHRKAVYDQYKAGTETFEFTKNYKFTILNNENVWAKAMNSVVNEKMPVDKAVDELIARIKSIAG